MASNNVIFDPDSGVPFAVNLSLYGGADFVSNLNVKNTSNNNFDLTGYSGSASISKSVAVGATLGITTNLTVGFTSAFDGKMKLSLTGSQTRTLAEGRYVYDVLIQGDTEEEDILSTSVAVGQTVGVGSTSFVLNKVTNVAVGDSVSVGAALTDIPVVSVASTTNTITIGTGSTLAVQVLPGTAVTFTRTGTATTIYSLVNGNIYVYNPVSSAP